MKKWAYLVTAYIVLGLSVYFFGGKNVDPPPCCEDLNIGARQSAVVNTADAVYSGWDGLSECNMVYEPVDAPRPETNVPFRDPVFGTTLFRLTGPPGSVVAPSSEYSGLNPFNSDNSHILIKNREGRWAVLDVPGFKFNKYISDSDNLLEGNIIPRWHPVDPHLIYYFHDNSLYIEDIITGQHKVLRSFLAFSAVTGTPEGRLSKDGSQIAVLGFDGKGVPIELFTYDVKNDIERLGQKMKDSVRIKWATVTPGGDYVVVAWEKKGNSEFEGTWLYNNKMQPVRQLIDTVHPGDIAYDADGSQVYVVSGLDSQKSQGRKEIIKISVPDGTVTIVQTLECRFHVNVSGMAFARPGWALVSTYRDRKPGCENQPKETWSPYEGEIYALKLDGTGTARRIAQHRNISTDLAQEPHVYTNRDMSMVVWNSNWGQSTPKAYDIYAADLTKEVKKK